jgi:hypothetical protein
VIEIQMVRRMAIRAIPLGIVTSVVLGIIGGLDWGLSAAVGVAMTIGNLLFAAIVIGRVAESSPQLLILAAMVAFTLGLAILTGVAIGLRAADLVYFPVTGFVLVGSHLVLVLWEAATGQQGSVVSSKGA